ncbi:MAG: hypothetical protein AB8F94_15160 [Saprospiraceae bacterium]
MDFLEKRINEHRDEFDEIERVDEGLLWQNIQADLGDKTPVKKLHSSRFLQIYAVAATVALLVMASWFFYNNQNAAPAVAIIDEDNTPQKFLDFPEEENYQQLVAEKKEEIDFDEINKSKYKDIFHELELLEDVHDEFKEDLPVISDEEKAIQVLQKYYERKIRILERLSKEIEKKSRDEKRVNEKLM